MKFTARVGLALPHLYAAARFSRAVGQIESTNKTAPFGPWWEEMRDNAVACLFLSVATLESYINELFSDHRKVFPDSSPLLMNTIIELSERKRILDKYDLALKLRKKRKLKTNEQTYKAIEAVIVLRNELTHYKPEWADERRKHKKTSDKLRNYITPNKRLFLNEDIFPSRWVSHRCTSWAVNSTLEFIERFEELADLVGRTDRSKFNGQADP